MAEREARGGTLIVGGGLAGGYVARLLGGRGATVVSPVLGQVATLRPYRGIADVVGIRFRGFPGWWVARTYHLYQLPLLTRKLRVVVDWTTALCFSGTSPISGCSASRCGSAMAEELRAAGTA